MPTALPVSEPFPIYASNGRYLLFDVNGMRTDPLLQKPRSAHPPALRALHAPHKPIH